jgi:nitronate monooxygenase
VSRDGDAPATHDPRLTTALTRDAGIEIPIICGAMYPCSNPELVAVASEAGAIGIVQPISLTYVHGHDYREGLRLIRRLTSKPIGMNALIEKSSKIYLERMHRFVDVSLEEGVRFFITSLGNPRWVVDKVAAVGGKVYHDVTDRKWAQKALDGGVHGLICVNNRAGGHAGPKTPEQLMAEIGDLGKPLICAGGVGTEADFVAALKLGYAGVQMGTRFIATTECNSRQDYKQAIVDSGEKDIVLTERITGVPIAVINTPFVQRIGTRVGPISRWLFNGRKTKHWMRTFYALKGLRKMKKDSVTGSGIGEYWQAGKSVRGIDRIEPAGDIIRRFAKAAQAS